MQTELATRTVELLARGCLAALILWLTMIPVVMADDCDPVDLSTVSTPAPPGTSVELRRHLGQLKSNTPAELLVLGDSLARRWPAIGAIGTLGSPSTAVYGLESDRIQNLIWRMPAIAAVQPAAKRIIIWIGTNNLNEKPCALFFGQQSAVDLAHQLWPEASVVLVGIIPMGPNQETQRATRILANDMAMKAQQAGRYRFVDASAELTCRRGNPRILSDDLRRAKCVFYQTDNIHLDKAGYAVLEKLIRQTWFAR